MGFWGNLIGLESESKSNNKQENISKSIIADIEKMKQKVLTIGSMDQELGEKIISELKFWEDAIQRDAYENNSFKKGFIEYKSEFNKQLQEAERKYIFYELKELEKEAEKDFTGEKSCDKLEYMQEKLEFLSKKGNLFTGERKNAYNVEVIRAKYRLQCCECVRKSYAEFYFGKKEKIIYSNSIQQDIMNFYENLSKIQMGYSLNGGQYNSQEIVFKMNELIKKIETQYPDELDFSKVFDNEQILSDFINIAKDLRNERINMKKNIKKIKKESEKIKKELEENNYYKNITVEEMREDIKKIDDESLEENCSYLESYKKILKYQKGVARAKGLLNKKEEMDNNVKSIRCSKDEVAEYMLVAKTKGIEHTVLMDVDDYIKANCMILISNKDKSKISKGNIKINPTAQVARQASKLEKIPGKYGKLFVFLMQSDDLNNIIFFDNRRSSIF